MSAEALLLEPGLVGGGILLLMVGIATTWLAANGAKRLAGLAVSGMGAVAALAALRAPDAALIAGLAAGFAQLALGAALLVRLQEGYGATDAPEIDAADIQDEPPEASS